MTAKNIRHFIVTRPLGQSSSLTKQLQATVNKAISQATTPTAPSPSLIKHIPLIQIQGLAPKIPELSRFDNVLFISGNAVKYFYETQLDVQFTENTKLFAIGGNSAHQLKLACGRLVHFPQPENSEGLLSMLNLQNIKNQHWLIVKGMGGRTLIRDTLNKRGAKVFELDVYQRKLPCFAGQQAIYQSNNQQTVWIITSAEALFNLFRVLRLSESENHATKVIVSSDRLAHIATQKGFRITAIAEGASEDQLVQCVNTLLLN